MKLLLILASSPNLVPDMLLHGLRKIFGDQVVDFPRKDTVYDGIMVTAALGKVPNLMAPDDGVDRTDIPQKIKSGYFDMIVVDVRIFNEHVELLQEAASPIALLDGEDFPIPISPGRYAILRRETDGTDFS